MSRLFLPVVLPLVALCAACPAEDPCLAEEAQPAFDAQATDEAWLVVKDAQERAEQGADAAVFTSPTDGAVVDAAAAAPTFSFTSPLKVAAAAPGGRAQRRQARSLLDVLSRAVLPPAYAHLPPVTSDIYLIEMTIGGRTCPLGVMTTNLEVQLDDDTWAALKDTGGADIPAKITSAYLDNNVITEGPFLSDTITFQVR